MILLRQTVHRSQGIGVTGQDKGSC